MEKPQRRQLITALASGLVCATVLSQIPKPAFASAPSHVTETTNYIEFPTLSSFSPSTGSLGSQYDAGGVITNLVYSQDNTHLRYLRTEQTASYVIFIDTTDSNKIKARNGTTGKIDYSGTNAGTIINEAISALTNGGKIFIKAGTYTLTATLAPTTSNIELCGEGFASILKLGNSINNRNLQLLGVSNWHIHDLAFDGNRANQDQSVDSNSQSCYVIQLGNANHITIDHCYIHDARNMGINTFTCNDINIYDNYVQNCDSNGITIANGSGSSVAKIMRNTVDGTSDVGISVQIAIQVTVSDNCTLNSFLGLSAYGVNSGYGIDIEGTGNQNITIADNNLNGAGISLVGTNTDTKIRGNNIYNLQGTGQGQSGIYIQYGTQLTVEDNAIDTNQHFGPYGIATGANGYRGLSIIGNTINNLNGVGINVVSATDLILSDNSFYNISNYPAIYISDCTGVTMNNNIIDTTVGAAAGIQLGNYNGSGSDYLTITGNQIRNSQNNNQILIDTGPNGVGPHTIFTNNLGSNPVGLISQPFGTASIGLGGTGATPFPSTDYTANGSDLIINVTGGTGVSITIKDGAGNTVQSGLSTITQTLLPYGFKINFGTFTSVPAVSVFGL